MLQWSVTLEAELFVDLLFSSDVEIDMGSERHWPTRALIVA